jgi:hypothetical protein
MSGPSRGMSVLAMGMTGVSTVGARAPGAPSLPGVSRVTVTRTATWTSRRMPVVVLQAPTGTGTAEQWHTGAPGHRHWHTRGPTASGSLRATGSASLSATHWQAAGTASGTRHRDSDADSESESDSESAVNFKFKLKTRGPGGGDSDGPLAGRNNRDRRPGPGPLAVPASGCQCQ